MPSASEASTAWYGPPPGCAPSTSANTPNVPARTSPAEVTVEPVRSSAVRTACRGGTRLASSLILVMTR